MKKLIQFSIFIGLIFIILFVILFGLNAFNIIFLIGLLYLVLILLFYNRYSEYSIVLKIAVVVIMILFNLIYLSFFTTLIVNFPKKKKVTNRFKKEFNKGYKIDGLAAILNEHIISLNPNLRKNLEKFNYQNKKIKELLNNTYSY